jgi:peptide/nickel transport system permease protein
MGTYLLRRLILALPTLFLVSVGVFSIVRLLPGDVVDIMYEEHNYAATKADMRRILGLDESLPIQYGRWVAGMFRGDFGTSLWTKRSAAQELKARMPVSLELGAMSFMLAMFIAIPIGILSAVKADTPIDYIVRTYAIGGLSIPSFWLATLVIIYGAKWFHWSPPLTFVPLREDPLRHFSQFIIPALLLGAFGWASVIRMTRTMMLEVLREDYIRTARAKGLTNARVIIRHAARNACLPVITLIGIYLPGVIGGAVIIETIFGLPGMGRYTVEIINSRDYPMLQVVNLVFASMIIVSNLLVDCTYALLDPRIRRHLM